MARITHNNINPCKMIATRPSNISSACFQGCRYARRTDLFTFIQSKNIHLQDNKKYVQKRCKTRTEGENGSWTQKVKMEAEHRRWKWKWKLEQKVRIVAEKLKQVKKCVYKQVKMVAETGLNKVQEKSLNKVQKKSLNKVQKKKTLSYIKKHSFTFIQHTHTLSYTPSWVFIGAGKLGDIYYLLLHHTVGQPSMLSILRGAIIKWLCFDYGGVGWGGVVSQSTQFVWSVSQVIQ